MIQSFFKKINLKKNFAQWIVSNLPSNVNEMIYIEPFSGGACVLLNKTKSKIEVINDFDGEVVGIYKALRNEPKELIRRLNLYKCCEETFIRSQKKSGFEDYLDRAVNDFIVTKMSKSESKKVFCSEVCQKCKKSKIAPWNGFIDELNQISERIQETHIFNLPAIEIIKKFDTPDVFLFCDPPILIETTNKKSMYESKMTTDDHIQLSIALNNFSGKVLLTGVQNPLYKRLYGSWKMEKKKTTSKVKKNLEVLWKNYE